MARDPEEDYYQYDPNDDGGTGVGLPIPAPPDGMGANPYAGQQQIIDPRTGLPPVAGGMDPYGQVYGDPNYGYPKAGGGTDPAPAPPPPSGGGSSSGGYGSPGSFDVSGSWPQFHAPDLPNINPFSFSYDSFHAPTGAEAAAEPGYAFARDEGIHALENAKSATGTLRTGGTLKDILGWGDKFAEQNYGNVYNRAANTYSLNRNNAYDVAKTTYGLNTGTSLDLYDRNFQGKLAEFNPKFSAAQSTFDDIYRRQRDLLDSLTKISTAGAGV